ncbi:hypothetical protein DKM19_02795 [Streptosporangium sp. 'caverna']|nr:hypothetical protein DKM19_02795 [Streptosporangium sp. 'caverna']
MLDLSGCGFQAVLDLSADGFHTVVDLPVRGFRTVPDLSADGFRAILDRPAAIRSHVGERRPAADRRLLTSVPVSGAAGSRFGTLLEPA